jgi:hypothetical protein
MHQKKLTHNCKTQVCKQKNFIVFMTSCDANDDELVVFQ